MRSSSDDSAVRKITGSIASSACERSWRTSDQPSIFGIITSVISRSGVRASARCERVLAIDRGLDAVAALLEHGRDHAQDPRVVVGDQDVRSHRCQGSGR